MVAANVAVPPRDGWVPPLGHLDGQLRHGASKAAVLLQASCHCSTALDEYRTYSELEAHFMYFVMAYCAMTHERKQRWDQSKQILENMNTTHNIPQAERSASWKIIGA